ncbi:MAG: MlrC C-terminal domain-containing protein, partial [Pseudomonadota bacterium]
RLGQSVILSVNSGAIRVVVCTLRNQVVGPEYFDVAGLDVRTANAVIVKSRGHFRAAFEPIADDSQVHEVDAPGLTTADIASIPWKSLPRPVYPMDKVDDWQSKVLVRGGTAAS